MNTNKILLGGVAGGIAFFFLGWVIYGMLFADLIAQHSNNSLMRPMEEFVWWAMIASNLVNAILLAIIMSWSNISGFGGGLKVGAIVGLLFGVSMDLSFYAMSTMYVDMTGIVIDVIAFTIMTGLSGGVIGWVMSMGKKD